MKHREREPSSRRTMRNMRRHQSRKAGNGWQAPKPLRKRAFLSGTATMRHKHITFHLGIQAANEEVRRQSRPDDIT